MECKEREELKAATSKVVDRELKEARAKAKELRSELNGA